MLRLKNDHEICPKNNIKGSQTIFYSCTVIQIFRIHTKPYQVFIQRSSSTTSVATKSRNLQKFYICCIKNRYDQCMSSHAFWFSCDIPYFIFQVDIVCIYIMVHGYELLPLYIFLFYIQISFFWRVMFIGLRDVQYCIPTKLWKCSYINIIVM